ncbi:hypothetical protein ACFLYA_01580 [Candidatus Dependentiae bacterium]
MNMRYIVSVAFIATGLTCVSAIAMDKKVTILYGPSDVGKRKLAENIADCQHSTGRHFKLTSNFLDNTKKRDAKNGTSDHTLYILTDHFSSCISALKRNLLHLHRNKKRISHSLNGFKIHLIATLNVKPGDDIKHILSTEDKKVIDNFTKNYRKIRIKEPIKHESLDEILKKLYDKFYYSDLSKEWLKPKYGLDFNNKDRVDVALELIKKENKSFKEYLLFAKATKNKELFRGLTNMACILSWFKKETSHPFQKIPHELTFEIIKFIGTKSLAREKTFYTKLTLSEKMEKNGELTLRIMELLYPGSAKVQDVFYTNPNLLEQKIEETKHDSFGEFIIEKQREKKRKQKETREWLEKIHNDMNRL